MTLLHMLNPSSIDLRSTAMPMLRVFSSSPSLPLVISSHSLIFVPNPPEEDRSFTGVGSGFGLICSFGFDFGWAEMGAGVTF